MLLLSTCFCPSVSPSPLFPVTETLRYFRIFSRRCTVGSFLRDEVKHIFSFLLGSAKRKKETNIEENGFRTCNYYLLSSRRLPNILPHCSSKQTLDVIIMGRFHLRELIIGLSPKWHSIPF